MRFDTPEEIIKSGQLIASEQLLRIAQDWGFEPKKGNGSSHLRLIHTGRPDIAFDLIINTKKLATQRELARLYIKIQKEAEEQKLAKRAAFAKAAEDRLATIRERLPGHITADLTQNGLIILRDAQLPQIGVTLYSPEEDRLIENKIHNEIEPMKREIWAQLNRMNSELDAAPVFENGVFTGRLRHEVYETLPGLQLPLYEEGSDFDIKTALNDYREKILDKDLEHMVRKEELLASPVVGRIVTSFSARRGERHNYVRMELGEKRALSFTFSTYSNRRVTGDGSNGRISESQLKKMDWEIHQAEKIAARMAGDRPERHAA